MERRRPRRLPSPRAPHSTEVYGDVSELSISSAAAIGEVAAADPDQIRLKNIIKDAGAAARKRQEASGEGADSVEFEFEPVTGQQIREKSEQAARAADTFGITEDAEVTLIYNFPTDQSPEGVTLQLIVPDVEEYRLIDVTDMSSQEEGRSDPFIGRIEVVDDSATGALGSDVNEGIQVQDKPKEVKAATDEQMAEYKREAGGKADQSGSIGEETDKEIAEHLAATPSGDRDLESSEIQAVALINQAIIDLQPPLPS